MLTRAEGEFAALGESEAAQRLARGVELFAAHDWPLHGFVPPAWLMGRPARAALARSDHHFEYVALRRGVYRLPQWRYRAKRHALLQPRSAVAARAVPPMIRGELARRAHGCPACGSRSTRRTRACRRSCAIGARSSKAR
jgi:predicted deacetylase